MVNKTAFQVFVFEYLRECLPPGTMFTVHGLYEKLKNPTAPPGSPDAIVKFLEKLRTVSDRGDLPNEPRYRNDIRQALRRAKACGLIRHHGTQRSGEWQRV